MAGKMKPAAVILILVLMVFSAVGFAMQSANFGGQPGSGEAQIPSVIREPLTPEQQIQILRSGRVLIEHEYLENCTDCLDKNSDLESFAARLEGYVVINEVIGNESRLDMIGSGGKITDLSGQALDYESLLDQFCQVAIAQPRACIIRDF
jgi:hypothetical protein